MVNYAFSKEVTLPFDTVLKKLPIELQRKGFDVLSNVRIDNELRKHLGVEFKKYALLGVCNLPLTYKALTREDLFGIILSCSIVLFENKENTMVGVIRPSMFMPLLQNEYLNEGTQTIERKLEEVINALGRRRFLKERKKDSGQSANFEKAVA